MNSSDPLPAAPGDRKLFSGPRLGLVSLMDLDQGGSPGVRVDGMAPPVPGDWGSGHSGSVCHDCEYITHVRRGLAWLCL